MRVIEGRQLPHAHEFPRTDLDHRHARGVVEVGNELFDHVLCEGSFRRARGTIASPTRICQQCVLARFQAKWNPVSRPESALA